MSLGYADRLKQKRNLGGQLGAKEYHQSVEEIKGGVQSLAKWVSEARRVFVFTGAGISTSCGIPDFRGPKGIWTLRKKKAPLPTDFTPFEYAKPSFTHMAISALVAAGKVPYVCSQNVDSLHLWSGVPRDKLAELHGNCFAERCTTCRTEYARDFQMETVDFKASGRLCARPGCGGPLVDNILDWDTPLPEDELNTAVQQAEEADVALVLGTSLQIQPANEIPTLTRDEGGKMVIVNLQKTPKDRKANLIIRGRVDLVMALLMQELEMQVPSYIRTETLVVEHQFIAAAADGGGGGRALKVSVHSRHGRGCPLPIVESLRISAAAVAVAKSEPPSTSAPAPGPTSASAAGSPGTAAAAASGSDRPIDGAALAAVREPVNDGGGADLAAAMAASTSGWGPFESGELCAASLSGGGGGFSHTFFGLPDGIWRVRCTLQVRLVKWADEDKRDVTLQHVVDLTGLNPTPSTSLHGAPATAPPPASAQAERQAACSGSLPANGGGSQGTTAAAVRSEAAAAPRTSKQDHDHALDAGSGKVTSYPTTTTTTVVHSFVSQRVDYAPADVIAAFLANPPPVLNPEPPRKRQKSTQADKPAAAAPTRTSLRRTRTSVKAREATQAAEGLSQEPSSPSASNTSASDESGT